ncbi:MAG: hypothetical protein DWI24_11655 [Planctomycetota bacterium]|nr:MAG: hypothetical protein DWI24_11655 [Planctomycetota bacterium]
MEKVEKILPAREVDSSGQNDSSDLYDTSELHKWLAGGGPSSVEVPLVDQESAKQESLGAALADQAQSLVLCVEAQEEIQVEFRKTFDKLGWRARMVKTSETALEMARERSPEFIVYDADGQGRESLEVFFEIDRVSSIGRKSPRGLLLLGPKQLKLEDSVSDDIRQRYEILRKPLKMREVKNKMLACSIRE